MESELILLIWPDYVHPLTLEQFEAESGVRVKVEIVPGAVELIERMRAPGPSTELRTGPSTELRTGPSTELRTGPSTDVLVPPDYAVRELDAARLLMDLDHSRLPNLQHLEPRFGRGRPHDPEGRVSVIKDWGTTGFMYRTDLVTESPRSWAEFWTLAEKYSGRVAVLDSSGEVIGAALKMRGHSYNAADPQALAQARLDLRRLKPHLRAFETNYRPLLASGDACLALGWNGDAAALNAQGVPVKYVVPDEGSQIWEDDWAIAAGAPHPEAAHAFVNFVLRPEVAAREARYTRYATGNRAALAMLEESIRSDRSTYPSADVLQKLEAGMPLDPQGSERRAALWAELRS